MGIIENGNYEIVYRKIRHSSKSEVSLARRRQELTIKTGLEGNGEDELEEDCS